MIFRTRHSYILLIYLPLLQLTNDHLPTIPVVVTGTNVSTAIALLLTAVVIIVFVLLIATALVFLLLLIRVLLRGRVVVVPLAAGRLGRARGMHFWRRGWDDFCQVGGFR